MHRIALCLSLAVLLLAHGGSCALADPAPDLSRLPAPSSLEPLQLEVGETEALLELPAGQLREELNQARGQRAWSACLQPLYAGRSVPYISPYELRISTSGLGSYWLAAPDSAAGGWQLLGGPFQSVARDTEQRIPIGLTPNAGDGRGAFSFAVISTSGSIQVDNLSLLFPAPPPPGKPLACHQYITARDGTPLATNIYLPFGGALLMPGLPYPAVIVRTPYRTEYIDPAYIGLATQFNSIVVTQYFRGRPAPNAQFDGPPGQRVPGGPEGLWPRSGGQPTLFREHAGPEHFDALDTVEWLEARPWYNGKLLATGPSALGLWIYQAAPALGSRLTAIYPQVSAGDPGHWAALENGCYKRNSIEAWLDTFGFPPELKAEALHNASDIGFWRATDFDKQAPQAQCAGMHETCWWDVNVEAGIESWRALNENGGPGARGQQWLIIGPWTHDSLRTRQSGALSFPYADALHDASHLPLAWEGLLWAARLLDRNPFYSPPQNRVLAYFTGAQDQTAWPANCWVELPGWPPAGSPQSLYLSADGRLSAAAGSPGRLSFDCDPSNPVPSIGGANIPVNDIACGPLDQSPAEERVEVLKFRSPALAKAQVIAGEIRVKLWVGTDAPDSDVIVKLVDCYPAAGSALAGQNLLVCEGAMRLSYAGAAGQDGLRELSFKIGDRAYVFAAGHRIGLDVQASSYPRFAVNPGTGGNGSEGRALVQHNTLPIDAEHAAVLTLPGYLPAPPLE